MRVELLNLRNDGKIGRPWQALVQLAAESVAALAAANDPSTPAHPWIERDPATGTQKPQNASAAAGNRETTRRCALGTAELPLASEGDDRNHAHPAYSIIRIVRYHVRNYADWFSDVAARTRFGSS